MLKNTDINLGPELTSTESIAGSLLGKQSSTACV